MRGDLVSKTLHRALGTLFCLNILLLSSLLLLLYSLKRVLLQRVCSLATLLWLNQGRFEIIRFYFVALTEGGTYVSTTPNTTNIFCTLSKLIQPSNMVTLSSLAKKISVYYWKLSFHATNFRNSPFSVINWTFFPRIQIFIFIRESTQNDHIRLLYKFENDQKNFGCVGSCWYAPASVNYLLRGNKEFTLIHCISLDV